MQTDDSFWAIWNGGSTAGAGLRSRLNITAFKFAPRPDVGAVLEAVTAGAQVMVGSFLRLTPDPWTLLMGDSTYPGQGEGYGVGSASTTGDGVIGVSSSDTSDAAVKIPSGVLGIHTGVGAGVTGSSSSGDGVAGSSISGDGVLGQGVNGVHGQSNAETGIGVLGENLNGTRSGAGGAGVTGNSVSGDGVVGQGVNGVHGRSSAIYPGSGVLGENTGSGTGVTGSSNGVCMAWE
jgi:hypothetical protein